MKTITLTPADLTEFNLAMRRVASSFANATLSMRRISRAWRDWGIRDEVEHLRLVARAEKAEALLHLERRMVAMYSDLGLVR